jgi:hypothetical protein
VLLFVVQAFIGLQRTAADVLYSLFSSEADIGLQATEQQLQSWLGQSARGSSSSIGSSSSVLHVSSYKPSSVTPAPLLGGSEEHVDRGLLTVIADTALGLQVGIRLAALLKAAWRVYCL